jgi:hypothetical protein
MSQHQYGGSPERFSSWNNVSSRTFCYNNALLLIKENSIHLLGNKGTTSLTEWRRLLRHNLKGTIFYFEHSSDIHTPLGNSNARKIFLPWGCLRLSHCWLRRVALPTRDVTYADSYSRLVAGFPPRRPGFKHGSGQVGFVVDKVALGQIFVRVLRFPMPIFIPPNSPSS